MKILFQFILSSLALGSFAQQISDKNYNPEILNPAYEQNQGPVVLIDEGHFNFHTMDGRYAPFARLLQRDGYRVDSHKGVFTKKKFGDFKMLIISNALNEDNVDNWYKPIYSAFTQDEMDIIENWVREGGSLFLIADHMPMAGASKDLAARFGFEFYDGFAMNSRNQGPDIFNRSNETLLNDHITEGRSKDENISEVATFTGQAFKIPDEAEPLLIFGENYQILLPDTAWLFDESIEKFSIAGWPQLAYKIHGKGRIMVSGEAAMFSAQLAGPDKIKFGMNSEIARENHQLLLNIIHWLDGLIE